MSSKIEYTKNPAGCISTYTGELTGQMVITQLKELVKCEECIYRLVDMLGVTKTEISLPELHQIAILECSIPETHKLTKVAFVGDTRRNSWLIQTYFLFIEKWIGKRRTYESRTFEKMEEACEWLGIDVPGGVGANKD